MGLEGGWRDEVEETLSEDVTRTGRLPTEVLVGIVPRPTNRCKKYSVPYGQGPTIFGFMMGTARPHGGGAVEREKKIPDLGNS
jgi:hypothetical protein